jgi:hypothetical protein
VTSIAPESGGASATTADLRTQVPELLRRYRKQLGAAAAVLVLLILVLVDHSGSPPIVDQAVGPGVAVPNVAVTTTGDPRIHAVPGTAHDTVDAAKLLAVTVTITSSADTPLVVTADGRLLASDSNLVEGFASGGTTVPAHGSATLQLTGSPPFSTVGSLTLDVHATAPPPPG